MTCAKKYLNNHFRLLTYSDIINILFYFDITITILFKFPNYSVKCRDLNAKTRISNFVQLVPNPLILSTALRMSFYCNIRRRNVFTISSRNLYIVFAHFCIINCAHEMTTQTKVYFIALSVLINYSLFLPFFDLE